LERVNFLDVFVRQLLQILFGVLKVVFRDLRFLFLRLKSVSSVAPDIPNRYFAVFRVFGDGFCELFPAVFR